MVKVRLDSTVLAQLNHGDTAVEICDTTGRTVGYYQPVSKQSVRSPFSKEELERRRKREPQIDEAEIARRLSQGGGRSLAEILADLEKKA
jgi:hypothetical protein